MHQLHWRESRIGILGSVSRSLFDEGSPPSSSSPLRRTGPCFVVAVPRPRKSASRVRDARAATYHEKPSLIVLEIN
jgi:hypothetical protein